MEKKRINQIDSRIDYGVILPVFLLSVIGMLSVYVAFSHEPGELRSIPREMLRQGTWLLVGALAVIVVMHFSSKVLWKLTPVFYGIGLVLMVLPLYFNNPAMVAATGSRNWVAIGSTSLFQPSELMKIAYILMLAYVVTMHNSTYTNRTVKSDFLLIGKMLVVTLPIVILIKLQDDFGTMLVFIAILGGVMLLSGISWKILIPLILTVFLLGAFIIYLVMTDVGREILGKIGVRAYQFARIDAWLDPFHDTSKSSFQQSQGLLAIASGGLFGKGFNVSTIYIPVRESDMIFTVPAENFGFVGSTFIILLYFILIYRMIRVTFDTNNEFYTYIATGIIMMILFHVFENIGANIGLLPLTGIPLPFISQGGTSLVGNLIGIGLILSMRYQKKTDYELWQERRLKAMEN
ncbi:MAG: FtsW/RodA/SpoVE family cell cycle protein [Lactobacillales bacterium]|jgi:rod shape determining protein RodA|nr:FtsW/RodA/SpoVE family cell cycle protein [Lactobacillales bacterium]